MGTAMNDQLPTETALVLFSGGQDSATCLAWALQRFARVEMLGFDYGQRHAIELACRDDLLAGMKSLRADWAAKLGDSHTLEIPTLATISDTALTRDVAIAMGEDGLPNTFVPGRNLVFLTFAAALAYRRGIRHIVGGMCETDYSGYPDCRDETIRALQTALNLGMNKQFELHTPLMWLDKASTWKLANELGGAGLVDLIREHSHTCYLGERGARHDWGYGCGECPACALRAKGWREYAERRRKCRSSQRRRSSQNLPASIRSASHAACGRRRGPRHRDSDAGFRKWRRPSRRSVFPASRASAGNRFRRCRDRRLACARLISSASVAAHSFQVNSPRPCSGQRHRKGLRFPGFAKHRSVVIAGDAGQGAGRLRCGRVHHAGSRYGSNASMDIFTVGSASGPHSSAASNTTV